MQVLIPSPLQSYTGGRATVESAGSTLAEVLARLDVDFPGIRFRMIDEQDRVRQHIRFFVGGEVARELTRAVGPDDEVMIVCSLSGG